MQSSKKKEGEYGETFYRPSVAAQKTSAEIINEARNTLRSLKTQRPFTPREKQRKLFGSGSSRTPENRPPSTFSLHASSFESIESRPVSSVRLSPLDHKPKLLLSAASEEHHIFPVKSPVDPETVRKVSNARALLFRSASSGKILPDKAHPPTERKKQSSEGEAIVEGFSRSDTESFSQKLTGPLSSKDEGLPFSSKLHDHKITEVDEKIANLSTSSQHNSDSHSVKKEERPSAWPGNAEQAVPATKPDNCSRGKEAEEENYWNMKILPILHKLETDDNAESLFHACALLCQALEDGDMFGQRFKGRTLLLKTLYKLVDVPSDALGLRLAKIILGLKVSGKNLLNVCKLVFKISRNEKNDHLIQEDGVLNSLLEVLKAEDLQSNLEAFLYCTGALKFMSGNTRLVNEMVSKGTIEILLRVMRRINEINESAAQFSSSGHLLVQLTATFRNLIDVPRSRAKFLEYEAIPELCLMLEKRLSDKDICTNVARIFSKLSSFNDCCAALADCSRCYIVFLALLNKHPKKQDLVVRIIFTLGNLTAKSNRAREHFLEVPSSLNTLIGLFQSHWEVDCNGGLWEDDGCKKPKPPSEAEDVLIKLVRVIANLSIHPAVGVNLATNQEVVALLLTVLEFKSDGECEELLINTTATINNLSFYHVENSVIQEKKIDIAEVLLKLLMSSNTEAILEAIRVFGNLSQYREVCDFIVQQQVYKFMIALLDARHQDVCFAVCGVLLNLTVDKSRTPVLSEDGGVKKLIDCLRYFGPTDWQLACLICKTLWNYSDRLPVVEPGFEEEDASALLVLLESFLDEDVALDESLDRDLRDYHTMCWETEFKPVAQRLLQKIHNWSFNGTLSSAAL